VGLFGIDTRQPDVLRQLVCPCHQSVFDPADAARPVGGPAARSLPQLPIAVDGEGYLVAVSDFDRPVGPIAWNEG
jgi:ubiquinol-cytochrome c reductase iron-sulfur subunit